MRTTLFALVALALPATVAATGGTEYGVLSPVAAFVGIFAAFVGIFGTLATVIKLAMKAGEWQQRVEHRLGQSDQALTALADRFGSVEAAVAEGADSRRDIRAAVDGLAERFEAGDAARQGIQDTLDNVAQALNP